MQLSKASRLFEWVDQREYRFCRSINRSLRFRPVRAYFTLVSLLGDGWFWYGIILLLPLFAPEQGFGLTILCTTTGLICTLAYKLLKQIMVRERPFIAFPTINCCVAPLDRYSFPSGHTLHAVCFTALIYIPLPALGLALFPFTLSIMASRVILGLHYPSDVAAGALIGILLALLAHHLLYPWLIIALA